MTTLRKIEDIFGKNKKEKTRFDNELEKHVYNKQYIDLENDDNIKLSSSDIKTTNDISTIDTVTDDVKLPSSLDEFNEFNEFNELNESICYKAKTEDVVIIDNNDFVEHSSKKKNKNKNKDKKNNITNEESKNDNVNINKNFPSMIVKIGNEDYLQQNSKSEFCFNDQIFVIERSGSIEHFTKRNYNKYPVRKTICQYGSYGNICTRQDKLNHAFIHAIEIKGVKYVKVNDLNTVCLDEECNGNKRECVETKKHVYPSAKNCKHANCENYTSENRCCLHHNYINKCYEEYNITTTDFGSKTLSEIKKYTIKSKNTRKHNLKNNIDENDDIAINKEEIRAKIKKLSETNEKNLDEIETIEKKVLKLVDTIETHKNQLNEYNKLIKQQEEINNTSIINVEQDCQNFITNKSSDVSQLILSLEQLVFNATNCIDILKASKDNCNETRDNIEKLQLKLVRKSNDLTTCEQQIETLKNNLIENNVKRANLTTQLIK